MPFKFLSPIQSARPRLLFYCEVERLVPSGSSIGSLSQPYLLMISLRKATRIRGVFVANINCTALQAQSKASSETRLVLPVYLNQALLAYFLDTTESQTSHHSFSSIQIGVMVTSSIVHHDVWRSKCYRRLYILSDPVHDCFFVVMGVEVEMGFNVIIMLSPTLCLSRSRP